MIKMSEYSEIDDNYEIEDTKEDEFSTEDRDHFYIIFNEGFIFKSLIEFFKQTTQKGNFSFTSRYIRYEKMDLGKKIFNVLEIDCLLIDYKPNLSNDELIIGINFKDVVALIGKVKRKESIKLFKKPNDPKLYISVISLGDKPENNKNCGTIQPYDEQDLSWSVQEDESDTANEHSFIIPLADFVSSCNRITSVKCVNVKMRSTLKGALFETTVSGTVDKWEKLGDVSEEEVSEASPSCITIEINANIVKALAKLGNLCQNGSVKIVMQKDRPLKIITRVGTYGTLKTYIFNDRLLEAERKRM